MRTKIFRVLAATCLLAPNAMTGFAYGPPGHAMVGNIADHRLPLISKTKAKRVTQLLDGLTLERAAKLPDDIKGWDTLPPGTVDKKTGRRAFTLKGHPQLEQQLVAFWKANRAFVGGQQMHRGFHFTDVPVLDDDDEYADGKTGRSDFDIVHMIPFCVRVLEEPGQTAKPNKFKITKAVAVILLAHYLGDLHQPLHVGAEWFDDKGDAINPDRGGTGFGDEGGNNLVLFLLIPGGKGKTVKTGSLHGYWDGDAFDTALGMMRAAFASEHPKKPGKPAPPTTDENIADWLARPEKEPAGWQISPSGLKNGPAEAWANEILPVAREAHERLLFEKVHLEVKHKTQEAVGDAREKAAAGDSYKTWAGGVVEDEVRKAGWRLAALLAQAVH